MQVITKNEFRGRKQKVGSVCFTDHGRLAFFLGYCPDCHGKVIAQPDEVKLLMRRVGKAQHRPMQRVAVRILRRYAGG